MKITAENAEIAGKSLLCVLAICGFMKSNGSVYVAVVFAALIRLFQLPVVVQPVAHGEAPARRGRRGAVRAGRRNGGGPHRAARAVATLPGDDLHVRAGAEEIDVARRRRWPPPPHGSRRVVSGDVRFADVQIFIESETAAHAYLAVE